MGQATCWSTPLVAAAGPPSDQTLSSHAPPHWLLLLGHPVIRHYLHMHHPVGCCCWATQRPDTFLIYTPRQSLLQGHPVTSDASFICAPRWLLLVGHPVTSDTIFTCSPHCQQLLLLGYPVTSDTICCMRTPLVATARPPSDLRHYTHVCSKHMPPGSCTTVESTYRTVLPCPLPMAPSHVDPVHVGVTHLCWAETLLSDPKA
jgi:hypothetical protein